MALLEGKTPKERKEIILAIVLGTAATLCLGYMFFFSSSGGTTGTAARTTPSKSPKKTQPGSSGTQTAPTPEPIDTPPQPLNINWTMPAAPTAARNIFAYFIPPPPSLRTTPKTIASQTPTPAPTPPWILSGVNPSNVTARTGDFTLEVSGDKFTSDARIYVDNQELPTQFTSAQRVTANVPASFIAAPGARQIAVRSSGGQLFSNSATLNIATPPTPQYTFIGLLGRRPGARGGGKDTAMLKKTGSTGNNVDDIISVQIGGTVGGRFRVTSINERAIQLVDTQLNIPHTLDYSESSDGTSFNNQRGRTPRVIAPGAIQPADSDEP